MENVKRKTIEQLIQTMNSKKIAIDTELVQYQKELGNNQKSSMGDKYETSRAMIHLEMEKLAKRKEQINQTKAAINSIQQKKSLMPKEKVEHGAFVELSSGLYFIVAAFGIIEVDNYKVMVISPQAPIFKKMIGLKKGDHFMFNDKSFFVNNIY